MKKVYTSLLSFFLLFLICSTLHAQVYWKDVAGLLYENCSSCHRAGEIGPFPIMSYKDASNPDHVYSIQAFINNGEMPPWKADPAYRHFLDERVLTETEKALISQWIDDGAPAGDTTLAPPPPVFIPGSQIGIPDKVLTMAEPFYIAGDDSDRYMCFVLPTNFVNSQNISAIEFRPGNAAVVHHSFIYVSDDSSAVYADQATPGYGYPSFGGVGDGVSADFLTLYGPGMTARYYPPGSGVAFPANSFVVVQIHYAPLSSPDVDQSSINLFYSVQPEVRKVFAKRVGEGYITNPPFKITANERDTFYMTYPIIKDYSLFAIAPHQHLLGESFMIWAVTPQDDTIPMIHIPKWDFHWQLLYSYPFMIKLPQGSKVYARASYDNTIYNPNNPHNPPEDMHYGESSTEEMCKYLIDMLEYMPGDEELVLDSSEVSTAVVPVNGLVKTPQFYGCAPNPVQTKTTLSFFFPETIVFDLIVTSADGRQLYREQLEKPTGFSQHTLDVSKLTNGTYFVTIQTNGKTVSKQLLVQR
ncbi:MAG: T9SS type A sorting domain-containing protein [Chitinophagaceae bacterium]|nr:T9SS type A sorting domain-containing protein [Chitinophagaceae bacterium]